MVTRARLGAAALGALLIFSGAMPAAAHHRDGHEGGPGWKTEDPTDEPPDPPHRPLPEVLLTCLDDYASSGRDLVECMRNP